MSTPNTTVWRLERYARVVLTEKKQLLPQLQQPHRPAATPGGDWQHYSSTLDSTIQLALLENNHLVVSNGSQIYESISLWEAKKWMRVIAKGDSALFILKHNDENRRFRIKFYSLSSRGSSLEACRQCISLLSPFIPVSEMCANPALPPVQGEGTMQHSCTDQLQMASGNHVDGSQDEGVVGNSTGSVITYGQSQDKSEYRSMSEMAKLVCQPGGQELGEVYKSTNFPTDQLGPFIRLCLTDSHFPGFVEAVERELSTITHK